MIILKFFAFCMAIWFIGCVFLIGIGKNGMKNTNNDWLVNAIKRKEENDEYIKSR
tara:strand:- start:321 stop:485 length:165 start_codon:yes stop_codon:yes gene_type:complete